MRQVSGLKWHHTIRGREVTIAGNLKDIFQAVVAVGNDVDLRGNTRTGSILISEMTLAGS